LRRELPAASLAECSSTAEAARRVAKSSRPWAALAPERAAREYDLQIIVPVANDYPDNVTRFWIVGREQKSCSPEQKSKTSLVFGVGDRPGALYAILREFAERRINLTRIESRPAKKNLGDYLFFIDLMGGQEQPEVREALREVAKVTLGMKVLGSYPVWEAPGKEM
jgi:prephenate dehydratase